MGSIEPDPELLMAGWLDGRHECTDRCLCFAWGCSCPVCGPVVERIDRQIRGDQPAFTTFANFL